MGMRGHGGTDDHFIILTYQLCFIPSIAAKSQKKHTTNFLQWPEQNKLLVNQQEARLQENNLLPRLLVNLHQQPVVSRNLTDTDQEL
jgi:hypothetical protein